MIDPPERRRTNGCPGLPLLLAGLSVLALISASCTVGQTRIAFGVGFAADLATTEAGLNRGATETNGLMRANPTLVGALDAALVVAIAEILAHRDAKKWASWVYGVAAVVHSGAALWNAGQRRSDSGTTATNGQPAARAPPPLDFSVRLHGAR